VYLFASSEASNTGSFMFFISTSIAAFAVFSYKQRLLSILFAVFTYVLFVMAYFIDFSILPIRNYSEDMVLFNIVVNFTAAFLASVMAIYLMITLNHYNALQLSSNNKLLTKTNAELDRFVYSTSHDLRAPLTSVMGLIDITDRSENLNEIRRYLGMMKGRLHSLDKFIKDITDYSRNNRLEVTREKVKLHDLAADVWESLKYTPEAQSIDFKIDIPETLEIRSDKNRLSIVLSNLISNAIRYHDLRKEEKFIRLRHQVNGKGFYIKVEDNGQGIPSEFHNKVFEMFFRGNENSQGSGLGLYIVKETMLKLSGTIKLESTPGVGTTFIAKFPY
jgi:signal transduction histidine kinase